MGNPFRRPVVSAVRLALVGFVTMVVFASPAALAVSGAAFTTVNESVDGADRCKNGNPEVNCNTYAAKQYVWLNGGPTANKLGGDGEYFFAVLVPSGQQNPNDGTTQNLSDGPHGAYTDRTFTVENGEISSYAGSHTFDATADPPLVRLFPYANTTNNGGVYIAAICSLADGYPVDPRDCKYDAFKIAPDNEPPVCPTPTLGVDKQGRKYITQTISDAGGVDGYSIVRATNVTLKIESYFLGTVKHIRVTGTKIRQNRSSSVRIKFTDVAGNSRVCDPVLTDLRMPARSAASRPVTQTFTGLTASENRVTVRNGKPGLTRIVVIVNGRRFPIARLHAGQSRTLDVRQALRKGARNRITLLGYGPPRAKASLLISN